MLPGHVSAFIATAHKTLKLILSGHAVSLQQDRGGHAAENEDTRSPDALERVKSRGDGDAGSTAAIALGKAGEDEREELDGDEAQRLPPNMYDVDKILAKTPLLRNDNAFHDTLNSEFGSSLLPRTRTLA